MANNVPPYENSVPKNALEKWGWGCYPPGYDRKVHGPYDPSRYYGPKDALADVKMRDLLQWIGRRNKTPRAFAQLASRTYYRWIKKFVEPRKTGMAPLVQVLVLTSFLSYCVNWKTLRHHKNHKYHW